MNASPSLRSISRRPWARRRLLVPRALALNAQGAFVALSAAMLFFFWADNWALGEAALWAGCLFFTVHTAWALVSWYGLTHRLVDGYTAFFASLVLFTGGQLLLWTVGALPGGILNGDIRDVTLQRTVLLVNAAIATFHFGALIRQCLERPLDTPRPAVHNERRLRLLGLALLAVGAPAAIVAAYEGVQLVAAGGYLALYQQAVRTGAANWSWALSICAIPGALIVAATAPRRRLFLWVGWAIIAVKAAVDLFLGWRGNALLGVVPMLFVHHAFVRPISRKAALAFVVIGVFLLPWVASFRNMGLADRLAGRGAAAEANPLTLLVREMGGSMTTVAHTIELVPDRRAYDYGLSYLLASTTPVPNLFWDVHPAQAHGSYATWITAEVDPVTAAAGGGLGFSMLAEAYANFGPAGAPLLFLVLGFAFAAFIAKCRAGSRYGRLFEALALSVLLFLPRSESNTTTRGLAWFVVVPYLATRKRSAGGSAEPALRDLRANG